MSDDDPALTGKSQYDDTLKVLGDRGKVLWQYSHLNICQTSGGACMHWSLIRSEAACGLRRAWANGFSSSTLMAKLRGKGLTFARESLAIDPATGNAWVLTSEGTIYGKSLLVFSPEGEQLQEIKTSGFDITYSVHDDCFWIVREESRTSRKVDREGGRGDGLFSRISMGRYVRVGR